jgi:hypothetical protein
MERVYEVQERMDGEKRMRKGGRERGVKREWVWR